MRSFIIGILIITFILTIDAKSNNSSECLAKYNHVKRCNESNRNESRSCNIKSNFDLDSYLMTNFGIGLRIHNKTGRVCKTKSRSNFVPWKIERKGNNFIFKSPSGYLGRKTSIYDKVRPDCKRESSSFISKSIHDIVVGNAEEPTEWSVFVHLPDRRLLLTNKKDVLTFNRRCLAMSSNLKDAKLLTLANVSGMEDDDTDDLLAEEESDQAIH